MDVIRGKGFHLLQMALVKEEIDALRQRPDLRPRPDVPVNEAVKLFAGPPSIVTPIVAWAPEEYVLTLDFVKPVRIRLMWDSPLRYLVRVLSEELGGSHVDFMVNGWILGVRRDFTQWKLGGLLGRRVSLLINGEEYPVNGGRRLHLYGPSLRATLLRSYSYLLGGVGTAIAAVLLARWWLARKRRRAAEAAAEPKQT